jgi:hypothetical protein
LLLIGLRRQGLQYKDAEAISESYFTKKRREHLKIIVEYCGLNYKELLSFRNFNELLELFFQFTSRHRNRLMHGVALTYTDEVLLELLISVNKSFIKEFEAFLKHTGKPSFFDPPGKWGALRGKKADINEICKKLLGGKMPLPPTYNKKKASDVMKKLKKIDS